MYMEIKARKNGYSTWERLWNTQWLEGKALHTLWRLPIMFKKATEILSYLSYY